MPAIENYKVGIFDLLGEFGNGDQRGMHGLRLFVNAGWYQQHED